MTREMATGNRSHRLRDLRAATAEIEGMGVAEAEARIRENDKAYNIDPAESDGYLDTLMRESNYDLLEYLYRMKDVLHSDLYDKVNPMMLESPETRDEAGSEWYKYHSEPMPNIVDVSKPYKGPHPVAKYARQTGVRG